MILNLRLGDYMNQNLVPGPNRKEHIHSLIPAHRLVGLARRGIGITLSLQLLTDFLF